MNPGGTIPPPEPPPEPPMESGGVGGAVGRPTMTSGTPGSAAVLPTSDTMRTTSDRRSGSQAMSVRMDVVSMTTHSGAAAGVDGGGDTTLSPGPTVPESLDQLQARSGKSICSPTARKFLAVPSMVSVTGVARPVSRTISAAWRRASAEGEKPACSTESASWSNRAAVWAASETGPGLVPPSPQASTPARSPRMGHAER